MSMSDAKVDNQTWLLACIADRLGVLIWQRTVDGTKGRNRPEMLTEKLMEIGKPKEIRAFSSGEEFEKAWRAITNG